MSAGKWVVWYLLRSTVDIWEERDRGAAFNAAFFLEDEADDCVDEIIGIENPDGEFIDLDEYKAARPAIAQARKARREAEWAAEAAAPQFRITVSGPAGHTFIEVWTEQYVEKYRAKYVGLFGEERVRVDPPAAVVVVQEPPNQAGGFGR